MRKNKIPFERKPMFLLVDAYRKAGGVMGLAEELGVSDSAVYNWYDGIHTPSYESIEALRYYLYGEEEGVKPVPQVVTPAPVKKPEQFAKPTNLPNTFRKIVKVTRVFLGGSGNFVAFGTMEKSSVFITPLCVKKIAEHMGSIYEGDEYEFELMVDITKRSDYITHRYLGPA